MHREANNIVIKHKKLISDLNLVVRCLSIQTQIKLNKDNTCMTSRRDGDIGLRFQRRSLEFVSHVVCFSCFLC